MSQSRIEGRGSKVILRKLSQKLNADFKEVHDGASFSFDSKQGKGKVSFLQIFPGLEVWTFDVYLSETLQVTAINKWNDSLHIIFCLEGELEHKFSSESESRKILRFQNVIVGTKKPNSSNFTLPASTKLRMSIITITDELRQFESNKQRGILPGLLSDTLEGFKKTETYSYFGEISAGSEEMVQHIIRTKPIGLTNRLLIESSVLGVLQLQFSNRKEINNRHNYNFSEYEIAAIVHLSEYIGSNLQEDLTLAKLERISGINKKKIQAGFQQFFGETVNKFIVNVRILRGKALLETTDMTISNIVHEIGLSSRSYFSKIFSSKYGILPNEYRQVHHIYYPTFEISYFSKAIPNLKREDLQDILKEARNNNTRLNITGCLIFHRNYFFQILEGGKGDVLKIMEKIKKDRRHNDVEIVYQGIRSGRTFKEWAMAFVEKQDRISDYFVEEAKTLDLDLLFLGDMKSKPATRLMWEKVRNTLLIKTEQENLHPN
ncbi:BLUF domain-containing protein [Portibacter marinus]|uniref:BLUF domain-containing protein n=1 Tax=Portibacter marinus TaxID=2898660 RepID=UPI001F443B7A|nr:BLUF domain-containing protein [Portibacter marinus]